MSVAEKLKAEGRMEGLSQGLRAGKIQSLREFPAQSVNSCDGLETLAITDLENRHASLHQEYEARFKH